MERYSFKYYTLPIVQVGPSLRGLDPKIAKRWLSHVYIFGSINKNWRGNLSHAPMSVDYVPDISEHDITRQFETEERARRFSWYYRTLIFSMFTEFAYLAAGRPKWRENILEFF